MPWSERIHVNWELWTTVVPAMLVLFGAFATSVASRRHRRLTFAALLTSPPVVVPAGLVVDAMRAFAAGDAELLVGGSPAVFSPYGIVDTESRILQLRRNDSGPRMSLLEFVPPAVLRLRDDGIEVLREGQGLRSRSCRTQLGPRAVQPICGIL